MADFHIRRITGALILGIMLLQPSDALADFETDAVRTSVFAWCESWENGDIDRYMTHYHPAFRSGDLTYEQWRRKKKAVFARTGEVSVEIFGLSVIMEKGYAVARFIQRYRAAAFSDVGEKILVLEKIENDWKIIAEHWEPLTAEIRLPAERPNTPPPPVTATGQLIPPGADIRKGIGYQLDRDGSEKVCIRLDSFFIPEIFSLEGERPRIVIDIKNVSRWNGESKIPVRGKLIRQIRSFLHRKKRKLRIVLDLEPSENYHISQTYFSAEDIYCVELKP